MEESIALSGFNFALGPAIMVAMIVKSSKTLFAILGSIFTIIQRNSSLFF